MAVTNVLQNILFQLKKTYIIFVSTIVVLGVLLLIPGITFASIIHSIYLIGSCVFSCILGNVILGEYGKTYAVIQNNKLPILLVSLIIAIGNAVLLSIIFILYRITMPFSFSSILFVLIVFFAFYYLGAIFSLFLKGKSHIMTAVIAIGLILSFCFARQLSTFINMFKIMYNEGNFSMSYMIIILLTGLCLCAITNTCYYILDTKKIYLKK